MKLLYEGGGELVLLIIDRKTKKLQIATSKTNYKVTEKPWKYMFDQGKERIQEKITDKMNDEDFEKVVTLSMMKIGYKKKNA